MFLFLLILLILDGLLMTVIVLLQAGKGGGLAAMGGGGGGTMADQLIGGRQAATLLTRATWITGGIFLGLSVVLSVISSRAAAPASVLEQEFGQPTPVLPQPVVPPADAGTPQDVPGTQPQTPPPDTTGG